MFIRDASLHARRRPPPTAADDTTPSTVALAPLVHLLARRDVVAAKIRGTAGTRRRGARTTVTGLGGRTARPPLRQRVAPVARLVRAGRAVLEGRAAGRRPEPPDAVGLGAVSRSRLNRRAHGMDRQNRQTWIAATAVILTVVGTTWWTGRRMIPIYSRSMPSRPRAHWRESGRNRPINWPEPSQ